MSESGLVVVETEVRLTRAEAFSLFTEQIGEWWSQGKDLGTGAFPRRGRMELEPRQGGRLLEVYASDEPPFEIGRVLVWSPPDRLVFGWRTGTFDAHETTEVEVSFRGNGRATRVTLEHRGLEGLEPANRARHGLSDAELAAMMRNTWQELADSYAQLAAKAA